MENRALGRTGVTVSSLCLGTVLFGEWGTKDFEAATRTRSTVTYPGLTERARTRRSRRRSTAGQSVAHPRAHPSLPKPSCAAGSP